MTPENVNAYYDDTNNDLNFPAGILQPPFFDPNSDSAENYGAIGSVIGHEITHGFDDAGRKFDTDGNMRDWWSPEDSKAFEARARCFEKQYSEMSVTRDNHGQELKINGKQTLGENIADNGGLRIAYNAFQNSDGATKKRIVGGFTPEQRFFLSFGRLWCANQRGQSAKLDASINDHAPNKARVNGSVSNMPEFQQAFQCREDAPMVRQNACRVW